MKDHRRPSAELAPETLPEQANTSEARSFAATRHALPRLTQFAHGGGCGCKLSPAVLRELLAQQFTASDHAELLVGNTNSDDAAVWALDGDRCLVATTDFFTPIVDDPADFGRISVTNALSDIYAMGARPLFALAILGMPLGKIEPATVRLILAGGAEACRDAGIPIAGGHSIDSAELIYGLAVIGECNRNELRTNAGARAGDVLILTKPLGVGIYSAAFKRGLLDEHDYQTLVTATTTPNRIGLDLGQHSAVTAMTDVTGFAVLGHALEIARASAAQMHIDPTALPLLPRAAEWAKAGVVTGASARNLASFTDAVSLPSGLPQWQIDLLSDPQTSGGLLVTASATAAPKVLELIHKGGFPQAALIGHVTAGQPGVIVKENGG